MTLSPKKAREITFQILYSYDIGKAPCDDIVELLTKELTLSKKNVKHAQQRAETIQHHLKEIDTHIAKTSHSYDFDRIQRVEKNILRLGVYELLFDRDIPPKVAIAEAIRLARKFSTPESAHFINAILDAIYQESLGHEIDRSEIVQTSTALKKSEQTAHKASQEEG